MADRVFATAIPPPQSPLAHFNDHGRCKTSGRTVVPAGSFVGRTRASAPQDAEGSQRTSRVRIRGSVRVDSGVHPGRAATAGQGSQRRLIRRHFSPDAASTKPMSGWGPEADSRRLMVPEHTGTNPCRTGTRQSAPRTSWKRQSPGQYCRGAPVTRTRSGRLAAGPKPRSRG